MPRRCATDQHLPDLIREQDWVIHRDQALSAGLTRRAIDHQLGTGQWQILLPRVYLTLRGEPSRRQLLIGALLYVGPHAAIDGADACRWHGIKAVAIDDARVRVVEPWGEPARSTGFVIVRRTLAPISVATSHHLRFVDAATAVISATRHMTTDRAVLAALSDALQRGAASYDELLRAHAQGSPRNSRRAELALRHLAGGARSAPEVDFVELASASTILPAPVCNALLQLPDRRLSARTRFSSRQVWSMRRTAASLTGGKTCLRTCKNATTP